MPYRLQQCNTCGIFYLPGMGMNINDFYAHAAIMKMEQASIQVAAKSLFCEGDLTVNPSQYRNGEDWFIPMGMNAGLMHFEGMSCVDYAKAYFSCPPLSAIINHKAQSYTNGKTWILNANGKAKGREANGTEATAIRKLMAQPNKLQTWKQFEAQNYIYTQLFGYCIVLIMKPIGFENYSAKALWNIPPHICQIQEVQEMFFDAKNNGIESIHVTYGGQSVPLPLDNVFVFKDIMPSFVSAFFPDSRVKTLGMPINNIIGAYESRNMLINSRGALGMMTNQTSDASSFIPLKPGEKKEIEREFHQMYGLRKAQSHVIITSANLKWQSMVLPTKDLMLFEEIEDDANRICDAYTFPPELFAKMGKGTTFSNAQTATRNLYQDALIPESAIYYEQWNKLFDTDKYNIVIERDYTHLAALQPDKKAEAEARLRRNQGLQIEFRNNVITLNQWRIANGDDPKEGGDVYYSDIKDLLGPSENIEDTQVEDNVNPRDGNDGTPGQQA